MVTAIEEQHRGSLHAHVLIGTDLELKICEDVERLISCEIPSDSDLKTLVRSFMIHGPCKQGHACRLNKTGACKRGFPRSYQQKTEIPEQGYIKPKRTNPIEGGETIVYENGTTVTNSDVITYSPILLKELRSHVNVEIIRGPSQIIKYFFKYMSKGTTTKLF